MTSRREKLYNVHGNKVANFSFSSTLKRDSNLFVVFAITDINCNVLHAYPPHVVFSKFYFRRV